MRCVALLLLVLVGGAASCAREPSEIDKLRGQVANVTARAHAVIAGAHTDAELRQARTTLVDLQLELADLSDRIERAAVQSRR